MSGIRRKCFISYHHADQNEVDRFIQTYDERRDILIARAIGMSQEIIDSTNTDYVMRRIRELYLQDSTVTILLIGKCTWARRYVDWEIQSSLRHGEYTIPNGLVGIVLPSAGKNPIPPNRLDINLPKDEKDGYAQWYWYPKSAGGLQNMIDVAYKARTTKANLIQNPRDRFQYNKQCP